MDRIFRFDPLVPHEITGQLRDFAGNVLNRDVFVLEKINDPPFQLFIRWQSLLTTNGQDFSQREGTRYDQYISFLCFFKNGFARIDSIYLLLEISEEAGGIPIS